MVAKQAGMAARSDLPVVEEWVLASEAAVIMGVTRQYVHQCLPELDAHRISNYVVIPRKKALEYRQKKDEDERRREADKVPA